MNLTLAWIIVITVLGICPIISIIGLLLAFKGKIDADNAEMWVCASVVAIVEIIVAILVLFLAAITTILHSYRW